MRPSIQAFMPYGDQFIAIHFSDGTVLTIDAGGGWLISVGDNMDKGMFGQGEDIKRILFSIDEGTHV